MKKSVLFLIIIIAILSIFIISFFGTQANLEQFKVYISNVEITNYDRITNEGKPNQKKYIDLEWNAELGEVSIFIDYKIAPSNATEKSNIEFTFLSDKVYKDDENNLYVFYSLNRETQEKETIATLNRMGEVTFYRQGAVSVQLASKDGLEKRDTVFIKCK